MEKIMLGATSFRCDVEKFRLFYRQHVIVPTRLYNYVCWTTLEEKGQKHSSCIVVFSFSQPFSHLVDLDLNLSTFQPFDPTDLRITLVLRASCEACPVAVVARELQNIFVKARVPRIFLRDPSRICRSLTETRTTLCFASCAWVHNTEQGGFLSCTLFSP